MHVEDIKAALRKQGWTLASIANELDIDPSAVSHALTRQRSRRIEQAIASKLGRSPQEIWPHRYPRGAVDYDSICQQARSYPVSQSQRLDSQAVSFTGAAYRGYPLGSD